MTRKKRIDLKTTVALVDWLNARRAELTNNPQTLGQIMADALEQAGINVSATYLKRLTDTLGIPLRRRYYRDDMQSSSIEERIAQLEARVSQLEFVFAELDDGGQV